MPQIFLAHSSEDKEYLDTIGDTFYGTDISIYIASRIMEPKPPLKKVVVAIETSRALFALVTRNVANHRDTRDWVTFELGYAEAHSKSIFAWVAEGIEPLEVLKYLTTYQPFEDAEGPMAKRKAAREIARQMYNIAVSQYST